MPQGQSGRQGTRAGMAGGMGNAEGGQMRIVTVGVSNENYIEIISGLNEGEEVVLPTLVSSTTQNTSTMFPTGGGGGFPGGGTMPGGGGGMRTGTGGGGGGGFTQRGG
jgi:HlyD family secretion protein